jgi:hypothetical protein
LFSSKNLNQQLIRWLNTFTEFDVKIKKIPGSENKMVDLLSRNCTEEVPVEPRIICSIKEPCQICKGSSETIQCGAPPSDENQRVVQHVFDDATRIHAHKLVDLDAEYLGTTFKTTRGDRCNSGNRHDSTREVNGHSFNKAPGVCATDTQKSYVLMTTTHPIDISRDLRMSDAVSTSVDDAGRFSIYGGRADNIVYLSPPSKCVQDGSERRYGQTTHSNNQVRRHSFKHLTSDNNESMGGHIAVLRQSCTVNQVVNDENYGRQSITDGALIDSGEAGDSLAKMAQRTLSVLTGFCSRKNQPYESGCYTMTDYTMGQDNVDVADDVTGRVAAVKTCSQAKQLQQQRVTGKVTDMPRIPAEQHVDWPRETIIENQRNDKIFKRIFVHLDANSKPTEDEIETDDVFRHYVLQWQSLVCENEILHRKFYYETGKVTKLQFVAPGNMQRQILERVHVQLLRHTKTFKKI